MTKPTTKAGRTMLESLVMYQGRTPELATAAILAVEEEARTSSLGGAWAEAEASLPEGWYIFGVRAVPMGDVEESFRYTVEEPVRPLWWQAAARGEDVQRWRTGSGPTPAEALRALAAEKP